MARNESESSFTTVHRLLSKASTRSKLLSVYVITVILLAATLIFVFHGMGQVVLRDLFQSQLLALAKSKSEQVVNLIEQDHERVSLIASRTQMRVSLVEFSKNLDNAEQNRKMILNIIEDAKKSVLAIRAIDIISSDGTIVASTDKTAIGKDDSQNVSFSNALTAPYQGEFHRDTDEQSHYTISMPLANPGTQNTETIGVVRVELSLTRLMTILEDYEGLGKTGEILLLSGDAKDSPLLNTARRSTDQLYIQNLQEMLSSNSPSIPNDVFGTQVFFAFSKLSFESKNWYIITKIDVVEVMKGFEQIYIYIILLSLTLLIIGYFLIRIGIDVSFRNIKKLTVGTQRLGDGDLCYRIDIQEKSEIGTLATNFNKMADAMSHQIETVLSAKHELDRARLEAEAANVSKGQFLANMSHEIRTPMNGVLGFLNLFEQTPLNSEQREYIKIMQSSAETLLDVINDILDVSKIEAGVIELEQIAFDLSDAIDSVLLTFTPKSKEKGILLNKTVQHDVPHFCIGDPTKLKQVLINLIGNALKFTNTGEILVDVSVELSKNSQQLIRFTVKDTGIGMTQATLAKLFKPFTQADSSSTRKYGGTGLGLTLCKAYIEAMDGTIDVASELGVGTQFSFAIPLKSAYSDSKLTADGTAESDSISANAYGDLRVLLVEDNEVNYVLVMSLLNKMGVNCDIATNGEIALAQCQSKKYDLIFMDCQMPVLDGFEATRRLRLSDSINKNTRIIAMTAYAMDGDREKCLVAGMDDYIQKPLNIAQFKRIVLETVALTSSIRQNPKDNI